MFSARPVLWLLIAFALAASINQLARAQTPPPAAQEWPYRYIVSGPATATAGSAVTYSVSYELVNPDAAGTAAFVFDFSGQPASFEGTSVVAGPQGTVNLQTPTSVRWDFAERVQSGTVEVELRVDANAAGTDFSIRLYVPGTGIQLPQGSVNSMVTRITASGCGAPRAPGEDAIIGHSNALAGSVSVPELDLTSPITDGCFEFRNLALPGVPTLIGFQIAAPGYRPATWAHYVVLSAGNGGVDLDFTLHPGTEPEIIDPCPDLLAHPQSQSAALQLQAELCAQLLGVNLPSSGAGNDQRAALPLGLLALAGSMAVAAGAVLRLQRRTR